MVSSEKAAQEVSVATPIEIIRARVNEICEEAKSIEEATETFLNLVRGDTEFSRALFEWKLKRCCTDLVLEYYQGTRRAAFNSVRTAKVTTNKPNLALVAASENRSYFLDMRLPNTGHHLRFARKDEIAGAGEYYRAHGSEYMRRYRWLQKIHDQLGDNETVEAVFAESDLKSIYEQSGDEQ